jgi:hypothetical protein
MLLTQKAIAEGGRAMIYSSALVNDQVTPLLCPLPSALTHPCSVFEVNGDR